MARAYNDSATQYNQALLTYDATTPVFGFGADIYATRTKTFNFGATLVRAKTFSFGAEIIDARGTYRGVVSTTNRNALTYKQGKDTAIVTDDSGDQPQHFYTGAAWITGGQHSSSEAGVNRYRTAATTGSWRAEIGDATYPLRFWDGTNTRFSVDSSGNVVAKSILLNQKDSGSYALSISGTLLVDAVDASNNETVRWGLYALGHTLTLVDPANIPLIAVQNTATGTFDLAGLGRLTATRAALMFGSGTASPDTSLYRSAANQLATDGSARFQAIVPPGTPASGFSTLYGGTRNGVSSLLAISDDGRTFDLMQGGVAALTAQTNHSAIAGGASTETALLTHTIPANSVQGGTTYRVVVQGTVDNSVTANTLTVRLRWGGTAGVALTSAAVSTPASIQTGKDFRQEFLLTLRGIGAATTLYAARWGFENSSAAKNLLQGGSTATIDTTLAKDLVVSAQWSSADANATKSVLHLEVGTVELVKG